MKVAETSIESHIRRLVLAIEPDPKRVLLRPFMPSLVVKPVPGQEASSRVLSLFSRVMQLDEAAVLEKLAEVESEFHGRHGDICEIFATRFEQIRQLLPTDRPISEGRRLLLGSYFINEYSLESTALFNPCIVPAPQQGSLKDGELRFYLSLRATGEGHVSSITFRSGVVGSAGDVRLDPVSPFVRQPKPQPAALYDLGVFKRKLREMGVEFETVEKVTSTLGEKFRMNEIETIVRKARSGYVDTMELRAAERALILAQANYSVVFSSDLDISEKILFPFAPGESNGIEDARFVRFVEDDGTVVYIATYTAYDGSVVIPQMLHTANFREFSIFTLNGPAIRNKGLALFPRKINGHYVMLGRQDGENIHLMYSDHLHFWYESQIVVRPMEAWEFVQLGNCGSPIETEVGWLVVTHGVGPMRKYCIGALLLDRNDPSKVIGRLREPLLKPVEDEREGYVPNVVYSCGALLHRGNLILPYAVSDTRSRFAIVPLSELLERMRR